MLLGKIFFLANGQILIKSSINVIGHTELLYHRQTKLNLLCRESKESSFDLIEWKRILVQTLPIPGNGTSY